MGEGGGGGRGSLDLAAPSDHAGALETPPTLIFLVHLIVYGI